MDEKRNLQNIMDSQSSWKLKIPWISTISSFIVLLIIGYFLMDNINWFKSMAFEGISKDEGNLDYQIYIYQLHLSMIKRSIGLFSGFAIMFLGIGISFYTIKELTKLKVESNAVKGNLATASPGIVAIIVGAILIMFTINSKDTYPNFQSDNNSSGFIIDDNPITE